MSSSDQPTLDSERRLDSARIHEIAEAMSSGRGLRRVAGARARLQAILDALAGGTVAEQLERQRAATKMAGDVLARLTEAGLPPTEFPADSRVALLETVGPDEERVVIDALDVLEPHFPAAVRAARLRHDTAFAAREMSAASGTRAGDLTRPELTRERVAELLELIPRIDEREPSLGAHLFRPTLPENEKHARRILGKRLATVVGELAGDVHAFARDLFWMHFIAFRLHDGSSIDDALFRTLEHSDMDAWKPLPRRRRELIAESVAAVAALLRRVGRSEEAAIKEMVEDVRAVIMRHRTIGGRATR